MKRRSPTAIWVGVMLIAVGGGNLFAGMIGTLGQACGIDCQPLLPIEAAAPMMIGGGAAVVIGIPLAAYGKKLVPAGSSATLHVSPRRTSVVVRF